MALEMTRILLDAGADVSFVGPDGSALHSAAAAGRREVVSALIEVNVLFVFRGPGRGWVGGWIRYSILMS